MSQKHGNKTFKHRFNYFCLFISKLLILLAVKLTKVSKVISVITEFWVSRKWHLRHVRISACVLWIKLPNCFFIVNCLHFVMWCLILDTNLRSNSNYSLWFLTFQKCIHKIVKMRLDAFMTWSLAFLQLIFICIWNAKLADFQIIISQSFQQKQW